MFTAVAGADGTIGRSLLRVALYKAREGEPVVAFLLSTWDWHSALQERTCTRMLGAVLHVIGAGPPVPVLPVPTHVNGWGEIITVEERGWFDLRDVTCCEEEGDPVPCPRTTTVSRPL